MTPDDGWTFEDRPIADMSREELLALVGSLCRTLYMQNYLIERLQGREPWPVAGSA